MKVAIMQPYIFPYIGYFQLMQSVDKWVVLDDVTFIKQGWINRNRILMNGEPYLFTVPLRKQSSFVPINQTEINLEIYQLWKLKFYKSLEHSYKKAPEFEYVYNLIKEVFNTEHLTISSLALHSIKKVNEYLNIKTTIVDSSTCYKNNNLNSEVRVLDICKHESATIYINVPGGKDLYNSKSFEKEAIQLYFIEPTLVKYTQFENEFIPWLSMIDVLFFNTKDKIQHLLKQCELIQAQ